MDILPNLGVTTGELAVHLGLPRSQIDSLLTEKTRITPDLAVRLGLVLGNGAHYWLALQMQFDLWQAAECEPEGIRPISWARRQKTATPPQAPSLS